MPHTILVADDSATIRTAISIAFEKEPYVLVNVNDGAQAISQARLLQPALVVADHLMPGKSGYEVAEALRVDPATSHIPVLMLSGSAAPFDEARFHASGAIAHIEKPFDCHSIIDKVNEIIRASEAGSSPAVPSPVDHAPTSHNSESPVAPQQASAPSASVQLPQAPFFSGAPPEAPSVVSSPNVASGSTQEPTVVRAVPEYLLSQENPGPQGGPVSSGPVLDEGPSPSHHSEPVVELGPSSLEPLSMMTDDGEAGQSPPAQPALVPEPISDAAFTPQASASAPSAAYADTITQIVPDDLLIKKPSPAPEGASAPPMADPEPPIATEKPPSSESSAMDFDLEEEFEKFLADVDDSITTAPNAAPAVEKSPLPTPEAPAIPVTPSMDASAVAEHTLAPPEPQEETAPVSSVLPETKEVPPIVPEPVTAPPTPSEPMQASAPLESSIQEDLIASNIEDSITDLLSQTPMVEPTDASPHAITKDLSADVAAEEAASAVVDLIEEQASAPSSLSRDELIREARGIIEKVVWEVVPTLAETLIREEIDRLMKERESN